MKQEKTKKSKLWLWIVIGLAVALLAVAGVVALVIGIIGGNSGEASGGRPNLYWNVDKVAYTQPESGLSTREAGEDGVYRVRFAYNGELVELPVADKQLVNYIDTMEVMGLVKDSDGVVVDAIEAEEIATPVARNAYVQQVKDGMIVANSSIAMNGMQYKVELTELSQIYNVSENAENLGGVIDASAFQPMDSIWIFANDLEEVTHVYMTGHPQESAVYWRVEQVWNSADSCTGRIPDENGVYSIDFCSDGGIVTLKCKEKSIVTSIDFKSIHSPHFGFTFDEEGYITGIIDSGIGIRCPVAAERIEVEELDGNYFSGTQLMPGDAGRTYSATLPENCIIYDASTAAAREGRLGEQVDSLQLGDRVCVWANPAGEPVLVYIANRLVDVPAYYNLTRKYDGTKKETTREKNAQGYYEFEVVETGKTGKQILKTKDKDLASFIDAQATRVVGLKVENGIILNAYVDDDIFGTTSIYGGYVPQIQGLIVSVVGFANPDKPTNVMMTVGYKAYDVSGKDVPYGTETKLRVGDYITVTRNFARNGIVIYVTRRLVGGDTLYYNLDYQYNSTTKETKRKPDAEGWYVFTLSHKGKTVQVKTKDKELANKMEASPSGDLVLSLRVHNGIAYEVYETAAAYGQSIYSGLRVSAVHGDGTYTIRATNGVERTLKMASDCVIYNVSEVYDSYKGERTYSLKVGDMVVSLADYRSEVKQIYVRGRTVPYMYVNKQQLYDTTNKVTMRKPDADGWYWYDLAVNGEVKKFKTKDVAIANKIDSLSTPFGLRVKGDEILNVVTTVGFVGSINTTAANGWDITSLSKSKMTVQYNRPGSTYDGDTLNLDIHSNVKIYDISPTAEKFGAPAKLKVGDRIIAYYNVDKKVVQVYITFHETRVKGTVGYCEHCKQEVRWIPWAGAGWDAFDCHYYLVGDVEITRQTSVGSDVRDYEAVLDLNGNKLTVTGARGFLAYKGDNISFIDSVGGGEINATGINGGYGGTVLIGGGSTVNLYGGTLSFTDTDFEVIRGAVISIDGADATFNMYGGTVKGGIANSTKADVRGGNIYINSGSFNLYDGVVEDGQALRDETLQPAVAAQGGNVYAINGAVINVYGGTIRNGYSNQHGGNIFLSTATLNMEGGTVTGGSAKSDGGNLFNQFGAKLNMTGGTIDNGNAGRYGHNLYQPFQEAELNLAGGTITGDMVVTNGASITVSGAPKITVGKVCGLSIPSDLKLTVGKMTSGAAVYVNTNGVFSEVFDDADEYANKGYFKAAVPKSKVVAKGGALAVQGEISWCDHCFQDVEWLAWPGTNQPASGHYFLGSDVLNATQFTINAGTDVVIDLYGNRYYAPNSRCFLVSGNLTVIDTVGGGIMEATGTNGGNGGTLLIGAGATVNLYSGTLKLANEHANFGNGGVLHCDRGIVNVYGGTIEGGHVSNNGGCIAISGSNAELNMYGGLITGGTADVGGGCVNSTGKLNIQGGTIAGSVYADPSSQGTTLSGATKIQELIVGSGIKVDIDGLSDGAEIYVNASGIFTNPCVNAEAYRNAGYVKSADPAEPIRVENNVMIIGALTLIHCPHCDQDVAWSTWPGTNTPATGHYFLSSDVLDATQFTINAGTDVVIDLRGNRYYAPAGRCFLVLGNLSIVDTVGGGIMEAAGTNGGNGGVILNGAGSTVNLYSGTLKLADEHANFSNGGVLACDRGEVNIYGGTIEGGQVSESGGSIAIYGTNAELNMYGGEIKGGESPLGADVAVKGTFNMEGGTIEGEVYIAPEAVDVSLSNGVEIGTLNVTEGKLVDVSALTTGAQIAVKGKGVFTKPLTNAESYLPYFVKLLPDDVYSVVGNAISVKTFTETDRLNAIHLEAEKMTTDNVFAAGGTVTAKCPVCGTEKQWTELNTLGSQKISTDGHYYLSDSVSNSSYYNISANVCLHLNGKDITSTGRAFYVNEKSSSVPYTLNIMGEGTITGVAPSAPATAGSAIDAVGSVNLYGGTYVHGDNRPIIAGRGRASYAIKIYDGAKILGSATYEAPSIQSSVQDLYIYGGTISNGKGGNIDVSGSCDLYVYGGTITGGTAAKGGNIKASGSNATVTINGGTITNGDVYIDATLKAVTVSGSPVISNLDLSSGKKLTLGVMDNQADVYVIANGAITDTLTDAASYLSTIKAADKNYEVIAENNVLTLRETAAAKANKIHLEAEKMTTDNVFAAGGTVTAKCPVCGTEKQWTELNTLGSQKISTDGHYYLSDSVSNSSYYNISANVCLHLNGKDITSTGRAFYVNEKSSSVPYTLNIMGEGTITGVAPDAPATAGSAIDAVGSVNLYGGTYVHGDNRPIIAGRGRASYAIKIYDGAKILGSATYEAPSIQSSVQDLYIYGGMISNGKGGNIDVSGNCDLYVYGGTITGGTAAKGGNIKASGSNATVTINGGTITNGDVYIDATLKSVTVSGDPVISNLDLTSGKKLTLGELNLGADITVNAADGAFTVANAKVAKYLAYFKAAVSGKTVKAENSTLVIANS